MSIIPKSLTVAVATRGAIDDGMLEAPPSAGPLGDMKQRLSAVESLQTLRTKLEAVLLASELMALPDFYILLIESRTWGFFHPTEQGFDPNCQPGLPRVIPDDGGAQDIVVIAADMVLQAILDGKLSLDVALDRRMMIVDAKDDERVFLKVSLDKALPSSQFSRFTCGAVVAA